MGIEDCITRFFGEEVVEYLIMIENDRENDNFCYALYFHIN